jgi:hypothetical protein
MKHAEVSNIRGNVRENILIGLTSVIAAGLSLLSCSAAQALPDDVAAVIEKAGENGAELAKVIAHYRTLGDSLKLEAAFFLIGNMEGHGYATYDLKDTTGDTVPFDVSIFPSYDSLTTAFATLESVNGVLDFEKNELQSDIASITSAYLIEQIDLAFKAWRGRPWAAHLPFDRFCQYVLPYRGSNEPLEPWRAYFYERYAGLEERMDDPNDPVEAASLINDDIMTYFTFDPRYYYHPTDQGLTEMLATGVGRCEDMTNITIYAMRANGLAVTSDYTPAWADGGNNHAWNAIMASDFNAIPFMGAEANPREYHLRSRPAKVYRKTFSHQKDNLVFQERKQEKLPPWLKGKSYVDVTGDYADPGVSVNVKLEKPAPDSVDIAYLCVFNSGEWKPIDWARIENGAAMFDQMQGDLLYLPAFFINEEVVACGAPEAILAEGAHNQFRPITNKTITIRATATTRRQQVASTDGIEQSHLTPGVELELFFWDDGWQSHGKATATDQPLLFHDVPAGCLYWLVAEGSDREERPFSYDDSRQVWW